MRASRFGAACVLTAVALLAPRPASAYCRLTTTMAVAGKTCATTGNPLYWPGQCVQYSVTQRDEPKPAYEDIRAVVDESFQTWLDTRCGGRPLPMNLIQSDEPAVCYTAQYNADAPNVNAVIFRRDWGELPPEAFGLTLVYHRTQSGKIVDADMQINETLGKLAICGDRCEQGEVDMQNVITHEAGHFLGLGHSRELDACMYGKATVGETSKRLLSGDDIDGICAVYGDRSEPMCSEADFVPINGLGQECHIEPYPRSCDCAVPGAGPHTSTRGMLALLAAGAAFILRTRRKRRAT
jgi:MYXO-CTERM domain-containing protein